MSTTTETTFQTTVSDLAKAMDVDRQIIYGLVVFLEKTGRATIVGVQRPPSGKGKGANIYELPMSVTISLK